MIELPDLLAILSIPKKSKAVPGTPIAKGAKRTYGIKISSKIPMMTVPKQNASHAINTVIEIAQIPRPTAIQAIPERNLIFLPNSKSL